MTSEDCQHVLRMFEDCLKVFVDRGEAGSLYLNPRVATACLSLYKNFVLFEVAHGNIDKALIVLSNLVAACPDHSQLWMLYARYSAVSIP